MSGTNSWQWGVSHVREDYGPVQCVRNGEAIVQLLKLEIYSRDVELDLSLQLPGQRAIFAVHLVHWGHLRSEWKRWIIIRDLIYGK